MLTIVEVKRGGVYRNEYFALYFVQACLTITAHWGDYKIG